MLWFRNMLWYRFIPSDQFSETGLIEALDSKPFVACRGAEPKASGFSSPVPGVIEERLFTSSGFHLIALQSEEKILPTSVVKDAVQEKVDQIQTEQSRKVFRKEVQQLKEELTQTLLPRAFTRRKLTRAIIAPQHNLIFIDTSSANKADELLNLLREALGSLRVELLTTRSAPARVMSSWVTEQVPLPEGFELGGEAEMQDPLESSCHIKVKGQPLNQPDIQAHINAGMLIERLSLNWSQQIEFLIEADLSLKRLKLSAEYQESIADSDQEDQLIQLDSDLSRLGLELTQLIPEILAAFGGEEKD